MRLNIRARWAIVLLCAAVGNAQNAITLAGSGYSVPSPSLAVAPGQLIVLHVYGLTLRTSRIVATPTQTGWPRELSGISVDLVQGSPTQTTPLELRALYQGDCAQRDSCSPLTGITLQIPFGIGPDRTASSFPVLRIKEDGRPVGGVILRPVSDNVHVMNTCDDTQIYISAAASVPGDRCFPVVMGQSRMNSLYNVARGGEELAMWLYGLGAISTQAPICCSTPEELARPMQAFQLNFDFRPNAPASPAVPGHGITGVPVFDAYIGAGTYQVNFKLPPVPPGLPPCDGDKIKSNLTVTVSGPASHDAAQICVAP